MLLMFKAVEDAYLEMAAHYRPNAPSDGFGHIQLEPEELKDQARLKREAKEAAEQFARSDQNYLFQVHGCPDGRLVATMYLALQAAQMCCGGPGKIRKVLELALAALPPE